VHITETVRRLAPRVRRSSTSHEAIPVLLKNGKAKVLARAERRSKKVSAEMPIRRTVLFQLVCSIAERLILLRKR
jgi:hypothetical protein